MSVSGGDQFIFPFSAHSAGVCVCACVCVKPLCLHMWFLILIPPWRRQQYTLVSPPQRRGACFWYSHLQTPLGRQLQLHLLQATAASKVSPSIHTHVKLWMTRGTTQARLGSRRTGAQAVALNWTKRKKTLEQMLDALQQIPLLYKLRGQFLDDYKRCWTTGTAVHIPNTDINGFMQLHQSIGVNLMGI